ncbi:hypothetical protein H2198_004545 [Neophaeococcomyces mojaviensis]|uniref:Uncharacterized protein n=1 Tax=Neophaeococcomyces mojaviensis TaxID=3383035 RepID=A0ACC3A860_9EURO|nr:hypothetical protein H2198_004545 [Knufia sp. JES_112]
MFQQASAVAAWPNCKKLGQPIEVEPDGIKSAKSRADYRVLLPLRCLQITTKPKRPHSQLIAPHEQDRVYTPATTTCINRPTELHEERVPPKSGVDIMSSISEESPLADQLKTAVQAKAIEQGWVQDEDDTSLAEYIVLMVANGKTQDQIAAELSSDLLQDATGYEEFAQWLTDYVATITGHSGGNDVSQQAPMSEETAIPAAYENDLGESAPDNAYVERSDARTSTLTISSPKGPKGLHGGPRGGRGGRASTQGRGGFDSVLHRTRGNDRINSHARGAPKGPKNTHNKDMRPGMQKALNGLQGQQQQMPNPMMQGAQGAQFNPISPQQQMEFMAMMEQQARMLAQFMPNMVPPAMQPGSQQNGQHAQNGQSLFNRVERGRGGMNIRGRGRGANLQNGSRKAAEAIEGETQTPTDTAMDVSEALSPTTGPKDPASTICYFNLRCLNKDCQYAHQSPVAPPGADIDMTQTCSFGAACKNAKCHAKHPSPAQITAHKAEQECRFWPNCTNPNCAFKHPTMPLCSFGASCTNKDCKFTHLQTKCKFNPCTNSRCPYQHEPGQHRSMAAFQWTKDQANGSEQQGQEGDDQSENHVSNRKFVVEGEEELIKPQEEQTAPEVGQAEAEVAS